MALTIEEKRTKKREYHFRKYHSDPEFRIKQIKYSSDYQKRMWATSEEFRAKKTHQRKNPIATSKGRPRFEALNEG